MPTIYATNDFTWKNLKLQHGVIPVGVLNIRALTAPRDYSDLIDYNFTVENPKTGIIVPFRLLSKENHKDRSHKENRKIIWEHFRDHTIDRYVILTLLGDLNSYALKHPYCYIVLVHDIENVRKNEQFYPNKRQWLQVVQSSISTLSAYRYKNSVEHRSYRIIYG